MLRALADAAIGADAVDYINLHGTGTPLNDSMECRAVTELFGTARPMQFDEAVDRPHARCRRCNRTGPLLAHIVGSEHSVSACRPIAGMVSSIPNCRTLDGSSGTWRRATTRPKICLSNSFAFGGNNASLLIGRLD